MDLPRRIGGPSWKFLKRIHNDIRLTKRVRNRFRKVAIAKKSAKRILFFDIKHFRFS